MKPALSDIPFARLLASPALVAGGACAAWFIGPLPLRIVTVAAAIAGAAVDAWLLRREFARRNAGADRAHAALASRLEAEADAHAALKEDFAGLTARADALTLRCHELEERCRELKEDAVARDDAEAGAAAREEAVRRLEERLRLHDGALAAMVSFANEAVHHKDRYRKNLLRLSVNNKREELHHKLSSSDLDEEMGGFYRNFDASFLAAFPDFLDRFNSLLGPGDRLSLKPDGSLPSEIRVLALMRLGFYDSKTLAGLLNVSVATIYNYRSRYKAKLASDDTPLERIIASL